MLVVILYILLVHCACSLRLLCEGTGVQAVVKVFASATSRERDSGMTDFVEHIWKR